MVKSNKSKITALFVLVALIATALIGVVIMLDRQIKTQTLTSIDYKIGALDEEGNFEKSDSSIVSKSLNNVDGLTIEFEDEAEVTVVVYFYDADENFVSATEELSSEYVYVEIEDVEYFKVVITPVDDENDKVTWLEKGDYVKQITVTFNK